MSETPPPWWMTIAPGTTIWYFELPKAIGQCIYVGWTGATWTSDRRTHDVLVQLPEKKRRPEEERRVYASGPSKFFQTKEEAKQALTDHYYAEYRQGCDREVWTWFGRRVSQAQAKTRLVNFLKRNRCPIPDEFVQKRRKGKP